MFAIRKILQKKFLQEDEEKAALFKKVKKYCDKYHKLFIEECLTKFNTLYKFLCDFQNIVFVKIIILNNPLLRSLAKARLLKLFYPLNSNINFCKYL